MEQTKKTLTTIKSDLSANLENTKKTVEYVKTELPDAPDSVKGVLCGNMGGLQRAIDIIDAKERELGFC